MFFVGRTKNLTFLRLKNDWHLHKQCRTGNENDAIRRHKLIDLDITRANKGGGDGLYTGWCFYFTTLVIFKIIIFFFKILFESLFILHYVLQHVCIFIISILLLLYPNWVFNFIFQIIIFNIKNELKFFFNTFIVFDSCWELAV